MESAGEEHIVQMVTDNGANFKAASRKLLDWRKGPIYSGPCATHRVDFNLKSGFIDLGM